MDLSDRPRAIGSARNTNTQDDPESRMVHILGHISRPVIGEGRSTPDRQMFFVNSRPCSLPQLARSFNEVYKSYNTTQSPFIFADIKLDTNAYDVNVSPDKRTILLHDQTSLLESIKKSLVELFDGHDQSVPQAKLLGKDQSTLLISKPSLIEPREDTQSVADKLRVEEGVDQPHTVPLRFGEQALLPDPPKKAAALRTGFINASLINGYAGTRSEKKGKDPAADESSKLPSSDIESALFESERDGSSAQRSAGQSPRIIQDFNTQIVHQHARQIDRKCLHDAPVPEKEDEEDEEDERMPASKSTWQKPLAQIGVQNAFDRMKPMRTPIQKATVTVGKESWSARRSRIHTPKFSLSGIPLNQTPKKPMFMNSFDEFSAPVIQLEESDGEGDELDGDILNALARSRSQHERLSPSRLDTNRLYESTSALIPPLSPGGEGPQEPIPKAGDGEGGLEDVFMNDSEKKAREEAKIEKMIAEAEEAAARPTVANLKRAKNIFKMSNKKNATINLECIIETSVLSIERHIHNLNRLFHNSVPDAASAMAASTALDLNKLDAEECLTLTVTKADFDTMRIIGQFNLGFILAVRPPTATSPTSHLFIIDQHASDEKYNFELFSADTVLAPQRLVQPYLLELTAVQEEVVLDNPHVLTANGFTVELDTSGGTRMNRRSKLTSLPIVKGTAFAPTDLEELLALLLDNPPSSSVSTLRHIPRPSKVRQLLASRACRSSVMVGKTLKKSQMERIIRHMGSMDKPWSCPHGRPTMRHVFELDKWEGRLDGDATHGLGESVIVKTDWGEWLKRKKQ
jgi:DNA mismatch repair protein PMS2